MVWQQVSGFGGKSKRTQTVLRQGMFILLGEVKFGSLSNDRNAIVNNYLSTYGHLDQWFSTLKAWQSTKEEYSETRL